MSAERVTRWACDFVGCGPVASRVIYVAGYGLPKGWKWWPAYAGAGITHTCDICTPVRQALEDLKNGKK
jgi:hypothetical protein